MKRRPPGRPRRCATPRSARRGPRRSTGRSTAPAPGPRADPTMHRAVAPCSNGSKIFDSRAPGRSRGPSSETVTRQAGLAGQRPGPHDDRDRRPASGCTSRRCGPGSRRPAGTSSGRPRSGGRRAPGSTRISHAGLVGLGPARSRRPGRSARRASTGLGARPAASPGRPGWRRAGRRSAGLRARRCGGIISRVAIARLGRALGVVQQRRDHREDRRQRGPQLVRERREEAVLDPPGGLGGSDPGCGGGRPRPAAARRSRPAS